MKVQKFDPPPEPKTPEEKFARWRLYSQETGKYHRLEYLVTLTISPEIAQDQPFHEVRHAWADLLNPWLNKRYRGAHVEWERKQKLGMTGVEVIARKGIKPAEAERVRRAIEKKFYDTSQEAVEQVRARWDEWERKSKEYSTGTMPSFRRRPSAMFTAMIRHPNDPERKEQARSIAVRTGAPVKVPLGWRKILKLTPLACMRQIVKLLSDDQPRTWNHISVELWDKTADVTTGKPPEEGLWMGTLNGYIEYTNWAPILFRITPKGKRWLKAGAKTPKDLKHPHKVMGYEKGIHPFQQQGEDDDEE
jgi:hypothetical protein